MTDTDKLEGTLTVRFTETVTYEVDIPIDEKNLAAWHERGGDFIQDESTESVFVGGEEVIHTEVVNLNGEERPWFEVMNELVPDWATQGSRERSVEERYLLRWKLQANR